MEVKVIEATKTEQIQGESGRNSKIYRVAAYCRVSTDELEQKTSYDSQISYYRQMIEKHPDWRLAGIYADEAVTGTMVDKRTEFLRLIDDCRSGLVDLVITKSISRFARNTQDVLRFVRELQDRHIGIIFEEEQIDTLRMGGELLLSILSAVYQQEVENISAHVKKGLRMKMQRGELVGYAACLGFDYDVETKELSINEEEAETVRYIFRRYLEGAGGSKIARELEAMGVKTKRGSVNWATSTVNNIIKNEKYVGDVVQGKTYIANPITKKRRKNGGEMDTFHTKEHHPAIISKEDFALAQEIRTGRGAVQGATETGTITRFGRQYAFSHMVECGFCGNKYVRRNWHSRTAYARVVWQCGELTKAGRKKCPHSGAVSEKELEKAFVASYNRINAAGQEETVKIFEELMREVLEKQKKGESLGQLDSRISAVRKKIDMLLDMHLSHSIEEEDYNKKYHKLREEIEILEKRRKCMESVQMAVLSPEKRLARFREVLEGKPQLMEFDRSLFEAVIKKVVIGKKLEDGTVVPNVAVFEYVHGVIDEIPFQGTGRKTADKEAVDASEKNDCVHENRTVYGANCAITDIHRHSLEVMFKNGIIDKTAYDKTLTKLAGVIRLATGSAGG